jgi:hypothetical protein
MVPKSDNLLAMKRTLAVLLALCLPGLLGLKAGFVVEATAAANAPGAHWFDAWIWPSALWLIGLLPVVVALVAIVTLWSWDGWHDDRRANSC